MRLLLAIVMAFSLSACSTYREMNRFQTGASGINSAIQRASENGDALYLQMRDEIEIVIEGAYRDQDRVCGQVTDHSQDMEFVVEDGCVHLANVRTITVYPSDTSLADIAVTIPLAVVAIPVGLFFIGLCHGSDSCDP